MNSYRIETSIKCVSGGSKPMSNRLLDIAIAQARAQYDAHEPYGGNCNLIK